jgi:hypothetical protein
MNIRISLSLLLLAEEDDDDTPAFDDEDDVVRLSAVRDILRVRNRGGVLAIMSSRFAFINSSCKKWT